MKKIIYFLSLLFLIPFTTESFGQKTNKNTLRIFVKDTANKPVAGAYIFIDNIKQKKTTNISGFITLKFKRTPKKISVFSQIFGIQDANYNGESSMIISYDTNTLKTNNNNNNNINNKDTIITRGKVVSNTKFQFRDIYEYLRGRVAGVVVSSDNTIIIRGAGSFNGSTEPLFILNGVAVSNVADISPQDIKNVTVLKGPEAAKYGVRGSNGVILIQTF